MTPLRCLRLLVLRGMLRGRNHQPGLNSRHKGSSSFTNARCFVGADIYLPLRS